MAAPAGSPGTRTIRAVQKEDTAPKTPADEIAPTNDLFKKALERREMQP